MQTLDGPFPAYRGFAPHVPVHCVTPGGGGYIHRYYDSSPFSPSGRYLALTRLPFEDRLPEPGDVAEIVVVDLETGETRVVADTRGWDVQLGAQLQWGADDHTLPQRPRHARLGALRRAARPRERRGTTARRHGVLRLVRWPLGRQPVPAPHGRDAARLRRRGSAPLHPRSRGAPVDDGIWLTDLDSGDSRLLVSIAQIVEQAGPAPSVVRGRRGDWFGFHVKWNPQGTGLMFVLRWLPRSWLPWKRKKRHGAKQVVTMDANGGDVRVAVTAERWARGGHHPNWCPDGEHVLMNLNTQGDGLRFARLPRDGSGCETLVPTLRGSGHPTLHPDGRHLLTDAYVTEPVAFGDGTAPIRLVDLDAGTDTTLVRIRTRPEAERTTGALRVDPHPAWDRAYGRIAFNACPEGVRQVFVADLREELARQDPGAGSARQAAGLPVAPQGADAPLRYLHHEP